MPLFYHKITGQRTYGWLHGSLPTLEAQQLCQSWRKMPLLSATSAGFSW